MPYDSWANRIAILRFVQDIPMSPKATSYDVLSGIESQLHALKDKPMLIQWGKRDWCFDDKFLQGWISRFPDASVNVYDDAAHYVLTDAHDRVIPRIQEFI
jgi:pimeloyl-ACP methyl ester carboxylesterase